MRGSEKKTLCIEGHSLFTSQGNPFAKTLQNQRHMIGCHSRACMAGEILHGPKQFTLCLCMSVSGSKLFSLSSLLCELKVLGHFASFCVTFCASVERMAPILRVVLRVHSRSFHAQSRTGANPAHRSACSFSQFSRTKSNRH